MSRRYILVHGIWLLTTIVIAVMLYHWTLAAFGASPENLAKPLRGFFRIAFSVIFIQILLGTQALVGRKLSL